MGNNAKEIIEISSDEESEAVKRLKMMTKKEIEEEMYRNALENRRIQEEMQHTHTLDDEGNINRSLIIRLGN